VKGFWHSFSPLGGKMGRLGGQRVAGRSLFSETFWSHPPGLNRRPADYETIRL
jgi:hypothetical protein